MEGDREAIVIPDSLIKYIKVRSGYSESVIRRVLELERRYFRDL